MRVVEFSSGDWRSGPVLVADRFWERFRGLIGRPAGTAMLIRGRSVHSIGLRRSCLVVAIDEHSVVLSSAVLRPNRMAGERDAHSMLELPADHPPPDAGSTLTVCARTQNSGNAERND